jgi:prepilin-type processing-associated H-X9-DG protein
LVNDWDEDGFMDGLDGYSSGFNRMRYADTLEKQGKVIQNRVRHGGPNVLFCDLHVVRMLPDQFRYVKPSGGSDPKLQWPLVYPGAVEYHGPMK